MGFIQNKLAEAKESIEEYKVRRKIDKYPEVQKAKLKELREQRNNELETLKVKNEIKQLKNSTGTRGQIMSSLQAVKEHLASVKEKRLKAEKKSRKGTRGLRASNLLRNDNESSFTGYNSANFEIQGSKGMHDKPVGTKSLLMQSLGGSSKGGVFASGSNAKPKSNNQKRGKTIIIKL